MRARPGLFLGAGLLIFIPLGLVDVLDDHIQEPLAEVDHDVTSGEIWIVWSPPRSAHAVVALLGDVLYTGIVARAVVSRSAMASTARSGRSPAPCLTCASPRADVLLALIVALRHLVLIVPGPHLCSAWFALIAPAIELEERKLFAGVPPQPRAGARQHAARAGADRPAALLDDLLSSAVQSKELFGIHSGFFVDWAAAVLADMLTTPLYALAVVIAFFQLRDGRVGPPPEPSSWRSIFAR